MVPTVVHWLQTLHDCQNAMDQDDMTKKDSVPPHILDCINKFYNDFLTSMSDDLHTPVVLAALSDPLKTINDLLHTRKVFIYGYILYWYGYVNSLLLFILVNVDCMVCEEHQWLGCVRELSHGLRPALVWHWTLTKGVRPFMDFKLICSAWKPNWCRTGRGWGVVRVLALV